MNEGVRDRAFYARGLLGGYLSGRLYPAERFIVLLKTISADAAASIERARAAGCEGVLFYNEADLPKEVDRLTGGRKADVVYDGIGRATFSASLDCLRSRGTVVSIGAKTDAPAPVEVGTLSNKGSLPTSPTLPDIAAPFGMFQSGRRRDHEAVDLEDLPTRRRSCHAYHA